ncbi:uncharacterized protein SOCE26_010660 [Sorangium cellulosum]|uniref:Uncharacterized protein n=1 Tax=Sorangium cellulosum TaxID=56 RepID=A0A2L0EK45_SORCE|nr:hypothetical protein [Sorangium cellulosum]AUX39671.1 uncharacterized protein SOCE26_010660 [Sorangium cellulosum]
MSRYRSEIEVVRINIQELEERLRRAREQLVLVEANVNLGPRARRPFSRIMYHLGRALGRRLSRRAQGSAHELAAARARLVWLEQRVAAAEAALSTAEQEAIRRAQQSSALTRPAPAVGPVSARPDSAPDRGLAYALGRKIGRLRRR